MKVKMKKTATAHFRLLAITSILLILISPQFMDARAAPSAVPTGERLRALAGSFYIGFASENNFWSLSDAAQYQETARTEFNILTPGNAMKWDSVHPQQNTYSFTQADQHVQWAQQNGMAVHGHTLVWHSQNPSWLTNGSWTGTTLTNVLYDHIDTVVGHYKGQILVWDVVNEAFEENGTRRSTLWQNTIGTQYIDLAFQRARAADPQAKLIYNDYNIETINSKSTAVYNMVADMKSRGIPIDGVGFQAHLTSSGIDAQSFADNMQRFAQLGLEIYITELDVRYPTPISQANLTAQANVYRNVLDRCLAQPACKALQVWGFTDKYSWIPQFFPGEGDALIFDVNYNPKPAYYAMQAQLVEIGPTSTPTRTPTGPTPTFTRTNTPTRTPTLGPSSLKVQLSGSGTDNNQQTGFRFRVQNAGASAVSNISVRIYFTPDGSNAASSYVLEKYYDQSGVATISGPTQALGNTYYFTVNFGAASLPAGGAWEYHTALHLNGWGSTYSSANDWWRMSGTLPASYTDWTSVPAYVSGNLVWGLEPTGGPTNTPTRTPTITHTPTATATSTVTTTTLSPIIVEGHVRVGSSTGSGLAQVVITTWFGGPHGQVTTDANGYYQVVFPHPLNQETVSLTPQLAGYTFSPDSYNWILYSRDTGPFTRDFIATSNITPTFTPTQEPGACSPVTGVITAPFEQNGSGTFCWQTSNLGGYVNSWNLASLTINGVDFTNKYASVSSYPPKINGYWYVSYTGNFAWSHFEAK